MSPDKDCLNYGRKLTIVALAVTLTGCSTMSKLNPFGGDEEEAPPPVAREATVPSRFLFHGPQCRKSRGKNTRRSCTTAAQRTGAAGTECTE